MLLLPAKTPDSFGGALDPRDEAEGIECYRHSAETTSSPRPK